MSPKQQQQQPTVSGKDGIVEVQKDVVGYHSIKRKYSIEELKKVFPCALSSWLVNRNLQSTRQQLRGLICFLRSKVWVVLKSVGPAAILYKLAPEPEKNILHDERHIRVDLSSETGGHLQQLSGPRPVNPFRCRCEKEISPQATPLLDTNGNIKMSTNGPDRGFVLQEILKGIPKEMAEAQDDFVNPYFIDQGQKRKRSSTKKTKRVDVVYVKDSTKRTSTCEGKGKRFCLPVGEPTRPNNNDKYKLQEFVHITRKELEALARKHPTKLTKKVYDKYLREKASGSKVLVVPIRKRETLRIKVVTDAEFAKLELEDQPMMRLSHDGSEYLFGDEDEDLEKCPGIPVSVWSKEQTIVRERLCYRFAKDLVGCYGKFFGSRDICECIGLNGYPCKRGTNGCKPHPAVAPEERKEQQFRNAGSDNGQLIAPVLTKRINVAFTNVGFAANRLHPQIMDMGGVACTKGIVTCGLPSDVGDLEQFPNNQVAWLSFANGEHRDKCDEIGRKDVENFITKHKEKDFALSGYQERLLGFDGFALPTTCGYQFLYESPDSKNVRYEQYFAMGGLGLAVPIEDGDAHHFLGNAFSHQTCVCLGYEMDGTIRLTNRDDSFTIFAWGETGGGPELRDYVPK